MGIVLDQKTVDGLKPKPGKTDTLYLDSITRGFGLRVRFDRDGKLTRNFFVQYRHEDEGGVRQRRQKIKGTNADKARLIASKMLAQIAEGVDPAAVKEEQRAATARTFAKTVEEYLNLKKLKVRDETFRLSTLYLTGPQYFGKLHKKPLGKITRSDVSSALDAIYVESGAPTASQSQKHLSAFFVWCLKRGHAPENPVAKTEKVKAGPPRERVLSDDELRTVWRCCQDDDLGWVIKLLILTGCRCDEIGRLTWSEVGPDVITLAPKRTKNGKQHKVPITDMMREIIEAIPRRQTRDHLFGLWADGGFTSWNKKTTLGDGINDPWTLHDIRRTFRTGLGKLKIPPHIAELCINHRKGGIEAVYDKYTYEGEIAAAFATWSDHVAHIVDGSERKVVPIRA